MRAVREVAAKPAGQAIKAVFFDYDGVLTTDKTGSLTTNLHLSRTSGVEFPRIAAALGRHNEALTLGKTTYAQVWPDVCRDLGQELSIGLLYAAFDSTPLNASMFSLVRALKRGHSLGIITDNKKERIDYLKPRQDLEALFCPIVVSSEVGASKKDRAIFDHALGCLSLRPAECVFIDNSRDNLVVPSALGFKTVFHDDGKNDVGALADALRAFGVF